MWKHNNRIFSLKYCITTFPELASHCLISSVSITCNSYSRCYRLPESCNQLSSALACWGHSSGETKMRVMRSSCRSVLRAPCTGARMSCVAIRQIILSLTTCFITANICWDSKIPTDTVHWLFTSDSIKQLPLLTQRLTSWRTWKTMSVWW